MKLFATIFMLFTLLFSADNNETKKHLKKQMEKEKKYSVEQKFYRADEYDFKGAEVDNKSLKKIPPQPDYNDDFDMDNVYD